jgi:hypothetical protein
VVAHKSVPCWHVCVCVREREREREQERASERERVRETERGGTWADERGPAQYSHDVTFRVMCPACKRVGTGRHSRTLLVQLELQHHVHCCPDHITLHTAANQNECRATNMTLQSTTELLRGLCMSAPLDGL